MGYKYVEHLPVVVDYSVADTLLPELCGGSNLKERLQTTAKTLQGS